MQSRIVRAAAFAAAFTVGAAVSVVAGAADLDYGDGYAPPPPPSVHYGPPLGQRWAGWYLGGVLGYGWGDVTIGPPPTVSSSHDGWLGGGIVGWNWQHDRFVIGLEGDVVGTDISGARALTPVNTFSHSIDWMAALRARAGVSVTPNLLLYASIGAAWADMNLNVSGPGGGTASRTTSGLQLGGGAEVGLTDNWSARLDYQWTDFDSKSVTYPAGTLSFDPDVHQVRGAIVYRF